MQENRDSRVRFPGRRRFSPSRWLPSEPGRVHLVVAGYGARLGKRRERLVVREGDRVTADIPFADIEQVTIAGRGATISSDAVYFCTEHGIPITFLTPTGRPFARLSSPALHASVVTRRAQMAALETPRGTEVVLAFVAGKLRNQAVLLKYFGKSRRRSHPELHGRLADAARAIEALLPGLESLRGRVMEDAREPLMVVEARASRLYWEAVQALLPGELGFCGRQHQGATDPVNVALNYGYGVLYNEAWGALVLAGLEPFAGFLHVDRSGRPSLVLDFVEEFRQAVVDRPVLAELLRGFRPRPDEEGLPLEDRRRIAEAVLDRLEAQETYSGKRHRLRTIVHLQARRLATALRGEGHYAPFVASW